MQSELTSRKKQALETKNKIYQASIKLIEQKGYNDMKIDDICKIAGVSVGSFYNYFKSKIDILVEIFDRADNYFENIVEKNLSGKNSEENIIIFFEYYAKYNLFTGLDTVKQLYNPNNTLFITKGRYMQELLIKTIQNGQEKNEILINKTAEEITEYLFVAARGIIYDWCIHDGSYDLIDFTKNYFKNLIEIFIVKKD